MLANFLTDENETWRDSSLDLQKDDKDTLNKACEQWRSFRKNENEKDTDKYE